MPLAFKRTIVVLVLLAAGGFVSSSLEAQAAQPQGAEALANRPARTQISDAEALALAARQYHLPQEALTLVNSAPGREPALGEIVQRYKFLDERDGELYTLVLDQAGQVVDPALQAVNRTPQAAGGRIDASLSAALTRASAVETLPVILWLKDPGYAPPPRLSPLADVTEEQAQVYLSQADTTRAAANARLTAPVATRLARLGSQASADIYAPVVYTGLTPDQIREAAGWPEVDTVYLDHLNYPELESVIPTVGADVVFARRITGRGVKIGVIEVGGRGDADNPYLHYYTQDMVNVCPPSSNLFVGHTTGVLGILYSSHPQRTGLATGASIWLGGDCQGSSSVMQQRSTAAVDWGARILNLSWGSDIGLTPGVNDRFYDQLWFTRTRFIVKSSGNQINITSPGLAYNVITVGNFDDKNTPDWDDDVMNPNSSWKESDPLVNPNDREKPEVVAPGTNINSTIPDNPDTPAEEWTGSIGTGSSFSAPVVSGIAAQIMQRRFSLQQWPEIVKAIIMASAVNNIEGSERLSEYDGAGGVSARHADDIASGTSGGIGGEQDYFCSTKPARQTIATIDLSADQLFRAVIVWAQDPSYSEYATRPAADLDLVVIGPNEEVITGSFSEDNTYEIVHFVPSVAGTYRLEVRKTRCSADPKYLGWAWLHNHERYQTFSPMIVNLP